MRRLVSLLIVLALLSTGCLGISGSDEETEGKGDALTRARAQVTDDEGAVAGSVSDTAVQPVEGANVTIVELNRSTTTDANGGFAIAPVPPGTYTLAARADGFLPARETVEVQAGETSQVEFLLTHLTSETPFMQTFELKGFMEYGWGLGHNITDNGTWVRDSNCDYQQIAGPNCRGNFDMEPPLETLVFEMAWEPNVPVGDQMLAMMRVRDNASIITGEWGIFSVEGESPIYHRMDKSDLEAVTDAFQERCEEGEDQFCGLNFWDKGWPMQTRVWPGWQCPNETVGFCPSLQQDYTQYVTAFYNAPAPDGYSIVEDNRPPFP